ncbi:hypothetical protein [Altererythrobacter sp. MTPC7]|uniref:hypothetical protein n=1 Tax=Altererythrobacter sp. MTPC7 TaxID=3056567 RepID=UPI0036F1ED96
MLWRAGILSAICAACSAAPATPQALPAEVFEASQAERAIVGDVVVPDRVRRRIAKQYADDVDLLAIQMRGARARELSLEAARLSDDALGERAADASFLYVTCLLELEVGRKMPWGWASDMADEFGDIVLDTAERRSAGRQYEQLRSGSVSEAPDVPTECKR